MLRYTFTMRRFAALVFFTALLASSAWAATGQPWPHEGSDLAPDLRITFDRLENGVRLAIFPNQNPQGRVSLRLHIAAGSLNENEDERGLAHFVEHMAFNGTTHFPAGKLVEFLQHQGMGFGADANAFTTQASTFYKLELSNNSPESLHEALLIFRDYADGILFEPAAVEKERGVILAEARVRDTRAYRREADQLKASYPGSLLPNRLPIGLPTIIQRATPAALRAFYQAWYQPDRMTIIVTGDVTAPEVVQEIKQVFADLKSAAPVRPDYTLTAIPPAETIQAQVHREQGAMGVTLALVNIQNITAHPFGTQDFIRALSLDAAYGILRERTDRLVARQDSPEGGFDMETETIFDRYQRSRFGCGTSDDDWKPALRELTIELRRAQTLGFTEEEIARQCLGMESYQKEAVANQLSRTSPTLADQLIDSLNDHHPILSPENRLALISAGVRQITSQSCQAALNEVWETGRTLILANANDKFSATPEEITEVARQGQLITLGAPDDHKAAPFGYTDFGPPGEVTAKTHHPESDSWELTFRNGVRLHFKQTAFEPNTVQIGIRFGTGRLNEPADQPGLGMLTIGQIFGGLGKHTFDELKQILTGTHGSASFSVGTNGFLFSSTASPDNALLFTQLLTAFIVDPALREESRSHADASIASFYQKNWDGPQGVILEMIHPQLAGGDTRIGLPRRDTLKAYSLASYKEWFLPQAKLSPMDVMIVGDLTVEAAESIVAKTVGALPQLAPPPDVEKFRIIPLPKKPFDFTWTVNDTKSQSGFVELFWPLAKSITAADQIRLSLLMDIVQDRMRSTIRETMGKTYSPSAGLERFLDFHNYGWLTVQIEADPAELLRVQKATLEQVAKILKQGVSADELQRAQQVKASNVERDRQTNAYWQMRLDESARYPELAEFHAQGPEATARATIAEINQLAREYLRADQVSIFRIVPKKAPKK